MLNRFRGILAVSGELALRFLIALGSALQGLFLHPSREEILLALAFLIVVIFFPQVLMTGAFLFLIVGGFVWMVAGKNSAMYFIVRAAVLVGLYILVVSLKGV